MKTERSAIGNQILARLPGAVLEQLKLHLRPVALEPMQVYYEASGSIDYVYFPLDSVVSDLSITEDGTTIETSMVGRDGVVGMSTLLGSECSRQ